MHNFFLKWIRISLIVLLCIDLLEATTIATSTSKESELDYMVKAKMNFINREKKFLEKQPISNHLKTFIDRVKRAKRKTTSDTSNRTKRSDRHKNHYQNLYVIRNGNLIPYRNISDAKRQIDSYTTGINYTVVPLVIPVSYEAPEGMSGVPNDFERLYGIHPALARLNVTLPDDLFYTKKQTTPDPSLNVLSTLDPALLESRHPTPDAPLVSVISSAPRLSTNFAPASSASSPAPISFKLEKEALYSLIPSQPVQQSKFKVATEKSTEEIKTEMLITEKTKNYLATPINLLDTENIESKLRGNREDAVPEDKSEKQVLNKILDEVEGLLEAKHCEGVKEGVNCEPIGTWISETAGMRFQIHCRNQTSGLAQNQMGVSVLNRMPPKTTGFMCDESWKLVAESTVENTGLVMMHGVNAPNKEVATFIGECRFCQGAESVIGSWMIRKHSRDCRDRNAEEKILSDVWRRDNLAVLQRQHLQVLNQTLQESNS